jgi:hypothetical protein
VNCALSLKSVPVPGPSQAALGEFVADKNAAIQLGKALFWDPRVGSDNKTACATCHFSAGADSREKNQLSPGLLRRLEGSMAADPDKTFRWRTGPNHQFVASDFPFTTFSMLQRNEPAQRTDNNDVASSQGVFNGQFKSLVVSNKGAEADSCDYTRDPDNFHLAGC